MNKLLVAIGLILVGCAAQKVATSGNGNTRTKQVVFLDENTYLLTDIAEDKSYGYKESNPVKVGGINERSGPKNERRFLNGLLGPNGEEISYYRLGSCCPFKTSNAPFENMGLLDHYRVSWAGTSDTLDIFINMYDEGDLMIPIGFTGRR